MNKDMNRGWLVAGCFTVVLVATPAPTEGQDLTVLGKSERQLIEAEISGDAAYEHIRYMTQFPRRRAGANGLWTVAEYYVEKAREYGLEDVKLIEQSSTTRPWNVRFADLWIVEPEPRRIAGTIQSAVHVADYSRSADVTAELVDVGAGSASELDAAAIEGKIVLTYGSLDILMQDAVIDRGAAGIVWYPDPFRLPNVPNGASLEHPDQIRWARGIPGQSSDTGREPTFAFALSLRQGLELRAVIASSSEPVVVHAVVDAMFGSVQGNEPWQVMVEAFIRGTEPGLNQDIVLTAHLQEEATSANDDASGTASVLEIGRALEKLIDEGRLQRPRRDIRLWWVTEIGSQRQYFADHPEAHRRMWVNINQDMVGANQALDVMRKQGVTRLPATRFHFFNDVMEAVVEYMVASNTMELAQAQVGVPAYPNPHIAHLGTQHRYNASVIFFHNNTDHMPFNESPIAVPGITFTNMPDHYIHSSDDDLWNVDRTQLGRNAVAAALIAYTMATVDSGSVPLMVGETVGRGLARLGNNLRLGLSWIAREGDPTEGYYMAVDQLHYAVERERRAIGSLAEAHPSARSPVEAILDRLDQRAEALRSELNRAYRARVGAAPPARRLSEVERDLSDLRPRLTAGPRQFLTARSELPDVPAMSPLMEFEVLNGVDGERTGWDIYRLVAAEAREAGEHYYGTVSASQIRTYLDGARAAGVITLE